MGSIILDDGSITPDGDGLCTEELEVALEVYLDMWLADHDIEVGDTPVFFPKRTGVVTKGVEIVTPDHRQFGAYISDRAKDTGEDGRTRMQYKIVIRQTFREGR